MIVKISCLSSYKWQNQSKNDRYSKKDDKNKHIAQNLGKISYLIECNGQGNQFMIEMVIKTLTTRVINASFDHSAKKELKS